MAHKQFALDERTNITIYKRRSSKNLRLSIASDGKIRVSVPLWAPYSAGIKFARSRQAWIERQRRDPDHLMPGQPIGKAHHLQFRPSPTATRTSTRVGQIEVIVTYPAHWQTTDSKVQKAAETAAYRALKQQAETLLPNRLRSLAAAHDFQYASVTIKRMKSRWGSCDQDKNIILNSFLMQLPWECIDYVIMHELMHTRIMQHGPTFWGTLGEYVPHLSRLRKQMREHHPILHGSALGMA